MKYSKQVKIRHSSYLIIIIKVFILFVKNVKLLIPVVVEKIKREYSELIFKLTFQRNGGSAEFIHDSNGHLAEIAKDLVTVYDQIKEVEKKNAKSTILRLLRLIDKEKKQKGAQIKDKVSI